MYKTYKGKFTPKNKEKYVGDVSNIVYRSLWERQVFRWADTNPSIKIWNSEEVVIPYICQTDNKVHRYFIDLYLETADGRKFLIEIKPKSQTVPPKKGKRVTKKYLSESLTYVKNQSKWKAAEEFALDNGCVFDIWTEDKIEALGIKINTRPKPLKAKPKRKKSIPPRSRRST
jgi:hypothetical protein